MIRSFRRNGLERLFAEGVARGLSAQHVPRLKRIFLALNHSRGPEGKALPGFRLHPLKGERRGQWACRYREIDEWSSASGARTPAISIWWTIIEGIVPCVCIVPPSRRARSGGLPEASGAFRDGGRTGVGCDTQDTVGVDQRTLGNFTRNGVRLAKAFGGAPETWLGMPMEHDLWHAPRRASRLKVKRLYQVERKAA
jgi:proteic killer suppression protein